MSHSFRDPQLTASGYLNLASAIAGPNTCGLTIVATMQHETLGSHIHVKWLTPNVYTALPVTLHASSTLLRAVHPHLHTPAPGTRLLSSLVKQLRRLSTSMEKKRVNYSVKNIPVAGTKSYMKRMMEKVESLVRRMRWKALFFEKPELAGPGKETYGFRTNKAPPQMEHLNPFENDLYDLVCNIQFSPRRNDFQKQLTKDVKEITSSPNVLVPADKTTNLYSTSKETYKQLLNDNITKSYKKTNDGTKRGIDHEAKAIATNLGLADRMQVYAERQAFITLKDHKEDFRSKPSCRLINPAKSEIGIVSKIMVERINNRLRDITKLQQWKNTQAVLQRFSDVTDKNDKTFIKFDIVEFYPSISEDLLSKAITFAKSLVTVTAHEESIIWHSRKSILFSETSSWIKRESGQFDVTMGSFDGTEICELAGLYILNLLCTRFSKDQVGLYRDDGLAALKLSGPQADKARKDIERTFKECGLRVTVEILLKQADFLDVTLDLPTGKLWPYRKPNNDPLYINAKSKHPSTVVKHLPAAISSRLASISCNTEEFHRAKPIYEEALRKSGFNGDMKYVDKQSEQRKIHKRNITWFNPPPIQPERHD